MYVVMIRWPHIIRIRFYLFCHCYIQDICHKRLWSSDTYMNNRHVTDNDTYTSKLVVWDNKSIECNHMCCCVSLSVLNTDHTFNQKCRWNILQVQIGCAIIYFPLNLLQIILILFREKLNSMNLLLYMAPIAMLVLLPATLLIEGNVLRITMELASEDIRIFWYLLLSSSLAYFVNLTNFLVTKYTSALTLQVCLNTIDYFMSNILTYSFSTYFNLFRFMHRIH